MKSPLAAFFVLATVVAALVAGPAAAQTTGLGGLRPVDNPKVLTLTEAFKLAGERSSDLRVAATNVDVARAQVTQAWASVLPRVTLSGDYTLNIPEQKAAFGSVEQNQQQALLFDSIAGLTAAQAAQITDPVQRQAALEQAATLSSTANALRNAEVVEFAILPRHVVQGALTATMPLFNARSFPLMQNAYAAVNVSKLATRQAQASVLWGVARSYYQLAATKQLVTTANEQVALTSRNRDLIKARQEQGYETTLSLERAELDVKRAEQQVRSATGGLRAAKAALASLLGLVEDFDVEPPPPFEALQVQADFDTLLKRAWDSRVDLRVQKEMLQ
ncbi:MAG TPA: TolC family protein, partial [Myxococcota bacterium]